MSYIGDIALEKTFDTKFCTVGTTGAPTVLAGSPVISAYVDNSLTQLTAGITLSVDFDGVVGLNNIRVVATAANGYAAGGNYQLVITTGTVGGTSVVGYVVAEFSIQARSSLRPTVADRTLDVSAGGEAGLDWANIGAPTTAQNLSSTNIDVDQIVASVSGAVGSVTGAVGSVTGAVGSVTAGVNVTQLGGVTQSLTDLKDFADDGYDPATNKVQGVVLTDTLTTYTGNTPQTGDVFPLASTEIADIKAKTDQLTFTTANKLDATIQAAGDFAQAAADKVWASATRTLSAFGFSVTVGTNSDKTGYTLSAAGVQAIWDALTSALTTVGSIGKLLVDNINATISSRLASASYTTPPTVGAIADAVWDETLADHLGAGSTGNALNAAGSAGDPWSTALPGAYGAGTAGKIVGDNVNATISSRATPAQVNAEADTALADVGLTTTITGRIDAAITSRSSHSAADVWSAVTRVLTAGTNIVLAKGVGVTGFNDLSAANVNAEVVDALNVDTYAEPGQEAPPATTTLVKKIGYLYKAFRNKKTQTATTMSLFADDGSTVDQKATISDDGTVYTHNEVATGP